METSQASPIAPTTLKPSGRVSKITAGIVLLCAAGLGTRIATYGEGILWKPTYPVLSDPSKKPPTEVPSLFSQSGAVMAISSSQITIRYLTPANELSTTPSFPGMSPTPAYSIMSFPISNRTLVVTILEDSSTGARLLSESPAQLSDITIGANVALQVPAKTLEPIAPLKIQIFSK